MGQTRFSVKEIEWKNLISEIAAGSERALKTLYNDTISIVYALVSRIVSNKDEADEVALDVYKYVWDKASDYDPTRSSPSTWLIMIARSRAIDKIRQRSSRIRFESTIENDVVNNETDSEDSFMAIEKRKLVQEALLQLSPKQRRVIELAYFYQLSQSEISNMLDMPIGSVKSTIRLAMVKLKESLKIFKEDE